MEDTRYAGLDYEHWSRGLNMHLGSYQRGMNPFDREAMLGFKVSPEWDRLRDDPRFAEVLKRVRLGGE